jgi:branched-chain amino acid transport system substrate-binding protein
MKRSALGLVGVFLFFSVFLGTAYSAPKELVVGGNFPLSGPAATLGIAAQRAVEHAAEVINQKGFTVGGEPYVLKVVLFDSKYVPAESLSNLEKMLAQGIRFIMSTGALTSVPLVEKTTESKVLQMTVASGSTHLTNPKYPLSFRAAFCDEAAFALYPWLAKDYKQIKTVALLNPSDETGFVEAETRGRVAKNVGFKVVSNEFFKRGSTDYYPMATKLVAAKPDAIDLGGTAGRDQGLAIKALRELGYKGLIVASYVDPAALAEIAGRDAVEGVILNNSLTEPTNQRAKEVGDWYAKKYGDKAPGVFYDQWDPLFMLIEAVKKANSVDPEKVAEALRTVQMPSVFGDMYVGLESLYGLKCNFCRPVPMGIMRNGKPAHLFNAPWPSDAQIAKLNVK